MKNKGFSLTELLVVVAIIGIVSAIAIPKYMEIREKSRRGECLNTLPQLIKRGKLLKFKKSSVVFRRVRSAYDIINANANIDFPVKDIGDAATEATKLYYRYGVKEPGNTYWAATWHPGGNTTTTNKLGVSISPTTGTTRSNSVTYDGQFSVVCKGRITKRAATNNYDELVMVDIGTIYHKYDEIKQVQYNDNASKGKIVTK